MALWSSALLSRRRAPAHLRRPSWPAESLPYALAREDPEPVVDTLLFMSQIFYDGSGLRRPPALPLLIHHLVLPLELDCLP